MNKNAKALVVLNTVTLFGMLFANFASSTGFFSTATVADISHKYDSLFAPANYAFIIWGFLFLLAIGFVIFQWVLLKNGDPSNYIQMTGVWFTVSNIANASWLFLWVNEMTGWSVIVILILLLSLIILTFRLRLELEDEPVRTIFFVWWPITFYLGWIMVATIACVSAWLVSIGWEGGSLSQNVWTIIMISIACLLYIILILKRNMREAAGVGIWAFIAIAVRQWDAHNHISIIALVAAVILLSATFIHVYKNRYYNIGLKLKRGEWK